MNMQQLLKQAEQMQEKMQRELAETRVESTVGGGMVTCKIDGHKHLIDIKIDREVIDPEDPGMLEDLVRAAVNEAHRKLDEQLRSKMGSMAGNLPGLF